MNANRVFLAVLAVSLLAAASCSRRPHSAEPAAVSPPPGNANTPATGAVGARAPASGKSEASAPGARAIADRQAATGNTIAPMPVPGDDSAASVRRKMLNLPMFGDYVYVTELPEAQEKVEPIYPEEARRAGVSGTVMVQALIDDQGRVVDTRIIKSIPPLDAAADKAIREWHFKPARNQQGPTAVWVGVPVTFTLH